MRSVVRLVIPLTLLFCVGVPFAHGQSDEAYEKVLVPFYLLHPLPGQNGAIWTTDFWLRNNGPGPVDIQAYDYFGCAVPGRVCVPGPIPPNPPTPPNITLRAIPWAGRAGGFLRVERNSVHQLTFNLRIRDTSRQQLTDGTEVPLPRESDFRTSPIGLPDVPTAASYRRLVRVYGLDGTRGGAVAVRVYAMDRAVWTPSDAGGPDRPLGETVVHLAPSFPSFLPAYTEVPELGSFAAVVSDERVFVEVESLVPDLPIWAFVTVVHNDTQQLTVISPQ